jgi:amidase
LAAPLLAPPLARRAALCVAPEGMTVAPEVEAALRAAAARLREAGWAVEELDALPPLREPARLQAMLWLATLPRGAMAMVERENEPTSLAVYRHMQRLAPPPSLEEFQDALTARAGLLRQWMLFFERFPLVLCPVSGELPFPNEDDMRGFDRFREIMEAQLTQLGVPLLGLPGLAVTTGFTPAGVPVGVQLLGPRHREDALLEAGEALTGGAAMPVKEPAW